MDVSNITIDMWLRNEVIYSNHFKNEENWDFVPLLNVNDLWNLPNDRLIRFQGMIQDMFDPEYYFERFEVVDENTNEKSLKNGKYFEYLNCEPTEMMIPESENNILRERHTLMVISDPAVNDWVKQIQREKFVLKSIPGSRKSSKRSINDTDLDDNGKRLQTFNSASDQKNCESSENSNILSENVLNFSIPNCDGKSFHVKIYDETNSLKLNEVVDVIGFLSLNKIDTNADCENKESQVKNSSCSLIPKIHCVLWKKVEYEIPLNKSLNLDTEIMQNSKQELLLMLTQLFLGDSLVAEYFLYHLISKIYIRNDSSCLGAFTLNISNIPNNKISDFGLQIYKVVEMLLLKSHYFPMTLDNMNSTTFVPRKDYELGRIISGLLQLSNNTHLIFDETKLLPGHLNESGVHNVSAVTNTIKTHKVLYDFKYYPIEYDCDIPILILSEGKSLLPSTFHIKLKPEEKEMRIFNEIVEATIHYLNNDVLDKFRTYIILAKYNISKFEIGDDMQEIIQNDFANMRQNKNATAEDLHLLLILTRLMCLSEGKNVMDCNAWKRSCNLETQRKTRL